MTDSPQSQCFTAIILAGDRGSADPLIAHTGAPCKALVRIGGEAMLYRVIRTLQDAKTVAASWICGPQRAIVEGDLTLMDWIANETIHWSAPQETPSTSAHHLMTLVGGDTRFLLTTADHPFLQAEMVDQFCRDSLALGADVTVGLVPYERVREEFPTMNKTVLRFKDGEYCGCNLFAFLSVEGRQVADFWRTIENERKRPLRLISMLGWWSVIRYRLGLLTLDAALARLSTIVGLRLKAVILPYGRAAVDVDSVSDYELVAEKFAEKS